jgi:hypothetical protein
MSNGWKVYWIMVVVTITNYLVMVMWSLPKISQMAGGGVPFDMRPGGYSFEEAMAFISAIDASDRDFYLNTQHMLDSSYPALLSTTLAIGLLNLLPPYWRGAMATIAISAGIFDYLENVAVAKMLNIAPDLLTPDLVSTASNWTLAKSVSTTIASLVLVVSLAMKVVVWLKNRKSEKG